MLTPATTLNGAPRFGDRGEHLVEDRDHRETAGPTGIVRRGVPNDVEADDFGASGCPDELVRRPHRKAAGARSRGAGSEPRVEDSHVEGNIDAPATAKLADLRHGRMHVEQDLVGRNDLETVRKRPSVLVGVRYRTANPDLHHALRAREFVREDLGERPSLVGPVLEGVMRVEVEETDAALLGAHETAQSGEGDEPGASDEPHRLPGARPLLDSLADRFEFTSRVDVSSIADLEFLEEGEPERLTVAAILVRKRSERRGSFMDARPEPDPERRRNPRENDIRALGLLRRRIAEAEEARSSRRGRIGPRA